MEKKRNFISALFDISFSEFVTPRIIKVLYVLGIIGAVLYTLFVIVKMGGMLWGGMKLVIYILSPFIFFITIIMLRLWLEVTIILFRIAENLNEIRKMKKD